MSGFVGIINTDQAPLDRDLLHKMTAFMAYQGPDGSGICAEGSVGLGHALLRTAFESAQENQPYSIDGRVWIVADARIDAREELAARVSSLPLGLGPTPDVHLILQAYLKWGEGCVEHLLGDFAFVIWDERERKLFGARDHFGVKQFFWTQAGQSLVVSNNLRCVRLHPGVSEELDELFIADFLLFEGSQQPEATVYRQVKRLPPAHTLTWRAGGDVIVQRYWTLAVKETRVTGVTGKDGDGLIEEYTDLLERAVGDRLRTRSARILMSGGLDSTSIAATAVKLLSADGSGFDLSAATAVHNRLMPCNEGYFAQLAGDALRIPIQIQPVDDFKLYQGWDRPELVRSEPHNWPLTIITDNGLKNMPEGTRLVLTGDGGDTGFVGVPLFASRVFSPRFPKLFWESLCFMAAERKRPPLGVRKRVRTLLRMAPDVAYPSWLNPDLERRLGLKDRWLSVQGPQTDSGAISPALESYTSVFWTQFREQDNPAETFHPVEYRYPFFDLRLVRFMLSLPYLPWRHDKRIAREAFRGVLPDEVIERPKTPLARNGLSARYTQYEAEVRRLSAHPSLGGFVDRQAFSDASRGVENDEAALCANLRVLSLNYWFQFALWE